MRATLSLFAFALLLPGAAAAHSVEGVAGGLESGLLHPILGPDHLIAMVAVGLWGAQLGRPLVFVLPVAFPMVMAAGGLLGVADIPIPMVEVGIALSAVVLGLAILAAFRAPVWLATLVVAAFAIMHGHAHGTELPEAAEPLAYGIGFVVSTGLLHVVGIVIGLLNDWRGAGPAIVRACGGAIAALGGYFLMGAV